MGADLAAWYAGLPRPQRLLPQKRPAAALGLGGSKKAGTIDAYYLSRHCAVRGPFLFPSFSPHASLHAG